MTLPSNLIVPLPSDLADANGMRNFVSLLARVLTDSYETTADVVNGTVLANWQSEPRQWIPILKGTSTAGVFTYTSQYGTAFRTGNMIDVWADVTWIATTATGSLYLELPYQVSISSGMQFCGPVQPFSIAFTAGYSYLVSNAISNSYRCEIWQCGSGVSSINLGIPASGRIVLNIRYIGQAEERG